MKHLKPAFFYLVLLTLVSCSDGTQIGDKITTIIKEKKITALVIEMEQSSGNIITNEYPVKKLKIEDQFIKIENEYINLGRVKSLKIDGKKLHVKF